MPKTPGYSDARHLRLVRVNVENFGGINSDNSLLITFPDDKNITVVSGDQEVGKTTFLECIKFALTGNEPDGAVNATTKKKGVVFEFKDKDDVLFQIKVTNTGYSIFRIENPGTPSETKSKQLSPKEWLKNNIGTVGVDPAWLKTASIEEQLEWIRGLAEVDEETLKVEQDMKEKMSKLVASRTDTNRLKRTLLNTLKSTGLFTVEGKNNLLPNERYNEKDRKYKEDSEAKNKAALDRQRALNEKNQARIADNNREFTLKEKDSASGS